MDSPFIMIIDSESFPYTIHTRTFLGRSIRLSVRPLLDYSDYSSDVYPYICFLNLQFSGYFNKIHCIDVLVRYQTLYIYKCIKRKHFSDHFSYKESLYGRGLAGGKQARI